MYHNSKIEIYGDRQESVPNAFLRQDGDSQQLSVIFPGWGYTVDMPVLYYLTRIMLEYGSDVLLVKYAYNKNALFSTLTEEERECWLQADVTAAVAAGLEQRTYVRVTLIGKSLGTLAMGHLVSSQINLPNPECLWLTPLLTNERLYHQILHCRCKSLFVIGTADPFYRQERLDAVVRATDGQSLLIPQANHGLELAESINGSVDILKTLITAVTCFFGSEGKGKEPCLKKF